MKENKDKMLDNINETLILLIIGLWIGILISWLYTRMRTREQEHSIENLQVAIADKEVNLKDLQKKHRVREAHLEAQQDQINAKEENIRVFTAQIIEQEQSIKKLNEEISKRKDKIISLKAHVEGIEDIVHELETFVKKKDQNIAMLRERIQAMQDNLTIIKGIGPKVSAVLRSARINSFNKLGSTDVTKISEILRVENPNLLRLIDPTNWPEQARLAAAGEWEKLSMLQNRLKRE